MDAIFDRGAPPPCPAPFNLAAYVLHHARDLGDKTALAVISPSAADRWSYQRLEAAVLGTARGFVAEGLQPGDRLLMRLGNSVEFPLTFLAALAADIIPVPTSAQLTASEVAKIITEVAPKLIVAEDGVAVPENAPCPVLPAEALTEMNGLEPAEYAMGDPERPGYIIYTSGTSGQPRAVTHAHRAIWARRMMWEGWYGLEESDRLLHAGAFNWTYTLGTGLLDPWTRGATALILDSGVTPDQLGALMKDHEATLFAAAPGVYRKLLRTPLPALPALRHGLSAGEKMPDGIRSHWEEATGTPIHEAFGMSECSTFVSSSPAHPAPTGTLGYPQKGRRVAVLGEDGPVNFGEPGVLAVSRRDPGLMLGYWGEAEETAERFSGEWFLTGDHVSLAKDGAVTYLGRTDDMINAGGIRVSPIEIESVLNAHPDIAESAAAEVEVKADTTVIAAFYVSSGEIDQDALQAYASEKLAAYKVPRIYVRLDALPKSANGKLARKLLREDYEHSH
ncbi:class I adenylate-forming enzyme family protein [Methyloligella solikamskensis]|uniref:Class I adenylate-forming enzyme family protein n=1 Tax=Methyloligella solikamskensis TaxID=1177756 RepID=A0ABW3JCV6_9HYPH